MDFVKKVITQDLAPRSIRSTPLRALSWMLVFMLALFMTLLSMGVISYVDTDKNGKIEFGEVAFDFKKVSEGSEAKIFQMIALVLFGVQALAIPVAYFLDSKQ